MGKYQKNYCSSWEKDVKLKSWIQRVPRDDTKGTCRFCKSTVRCHYRDLCAHADTEKQKQNAAPCSSRRTLFDVGCARKTEDQSIKVAELKLAVHVACHSSILTSDHLGEIVKDVSGRDISIHRTKCSALIKNVLCLVIRNDLFMDIQGMPYSLIIDESTDITAEKQFCVIVRYFSKAHQTILTGFLGMISLDSGTAEKIFNNMATFLRACHLDLAKCIGLATDGRSVMCGQNNDIDNPENHLPLGAIYYGTNFTLSVEEATIDREIVNQVKERCRNYLMELLREMRKRLPTNMEQLLSISSLSPSIVLGQAKPKLQDLSFLSLYDGNIAILEEQWNRMSVMQWPHTDDKDTEGFWINIAYHKDASGENDFEELGMFILSLLALPFSNASVEGTLSQMNILKSKLRNKMQQPMLEALLHIRSFMARIWWPMSAIEFLLI